MGLRALFGKDPEADLTKAERLLALEPVRALELAERASRSDSPQLSSRGQELAARARGRILENVLARAAEAEAKDSLEEAASWLEAALVHERDEACREALAARRAQLLDRVEEERNPFAGGSGRRRAAVADGQWDGGGDAAGDGDAPGRGSAAEGFDGDADGDVDSRYETLVAMLAEPVAPLYAERQQEFRQAHVELNDGDGAAALPRLEALLGERPDDPVLLLERGRARLLVGDAAGARADFDRAGSTLGDGPLDATDTLSVPALAAEAALAAGDPGAVVERLAPLADPADRRVELCQLHAAALVALRDAGAVPYLQRATRVFERDPRFPLHLARALEQRGDLDAAIDCLETAVAPSCAGRNCGRMAKHLPSLRALAELHLARATQVDRAAELMAIVAHDQDGLLAAEDHATLARYYRLAGDPESAGWCEAEAQRLRDAGGDELSPPPGSLIPGRQRVL